MGDIADQIIQDGMDWEVLVHYYGECGEYCIYCATEERETETSNKNRNE